MGTTFGVILVAVALAVGLGIAVVANRSVKNFKDEQYVAFTAKNSTSSR